MKIACVTTTINVPHVLRLYAAHDADVMFIVIGDRKTPDVAVANSLLDVPNHMYHSVGMQYRLGWKCVEHIPENCIQRRNIGFLEALKWGAEIIVTIDDDNLPIDSAYFATFDELFTRPYNGLQVSGAPWWDPGHLLLPKVKHRGIPHAGAHDACEQKVGFTCDGRIGVAAGLCLGDPDCDAVTRLERGPLVDSVSELGRSGVVVDPSTWTVFNSQNTAFLRALTPAMFLTPHVGRYDDIFASMITRRIMREQGLLTHFGPPFVYQQRNQHDLIKDLKAEMLGMEHIEDTAKSLDAIPAFATDVDPVRQVYHVLEHTSWLPRAAVDAAVAYLLDCEKVMR